MKGPRRRSEIARLAAEANVSLIGPNCMGLISNERSLHALGFIVLHPVKGKLSIMSQSGNLGVQIVHSCQRRGIGIDKFVSVGNEAQIGAVDLMEYLRDDPATTSIMLYLEGIDDGRHFLEAARRTTAVKPVVVVRGGMTEYGGKAAASHTGAMAGSGPVYLAAARQAGVVTCTSTQDAVDLASSLAYLPLPKGRRVAVVTNGGGAGVLMADEVARNGLELAEFPPELIAAVDELLPSFWSRRNPLDMVATAGGDVGPRVLELVAGCDTVDAIVVLSVLGRSQYWRRGAGGERPGRVRGAQPLGDQVHEAGLGPHRDDRQAHHQRARHAHPRLALRLRRALRTHRSVLAGSRRHRTGPDGLVRRIPSQPSARGREDMTEILSGNEAIARGAWEAGVRLAAAYPGTPSTEILENIAKYDGIYTEWSPNEKVAMEVGIGRLHGRGAGARVHEARGR